MGIRELPPELISLVHHVALNESGWWKKAIRRMVIAVVWMADRPLTSREIAESMSNQFGIALELSSVVANVSALCSEKILVSNGPGSSATVKVAEEYIRQFEKDLKSSKLDAAKAKGQFSTLIKSYCPTVVSG